MKVSVNDVELFELTEIQKKVISNDINEDMLDDDLKRRIEYIVKHKYEQCMKRLVEEWMPKLKGKVESVPTDDDALAELIFRQPEYKSRKQKVADEDAKRLAENIL